MSNKIITTMLVGLSALTLGACGNQSTDHKTSDDSVKSEKTVKSAKSKTINKESITSLSQSSSQVSSLSVSSSTSSSMVSSSSITTEVTDKQLGTMIGFLIYPDWYKDNLSRNDMYYGTVSRDDGSNRYGGLKGYSYISAHGDGASFVYYKRNGNTITVKYSDAGATGAVHTREISYDNLLKEFYQNQNQKDEVNTDADKMQQDPQGYM